MPPGRRRPPWPANRRRAARGHAATNGSAPGPAAGRRPGIPAGETGARHSRRSRRLLASLGAGAVKAAQRPAGIGAQRRALTEAAGGGAMLPVGSGGRAGRWSPKPVLTGLGCSPSGSARAGPRGRSVLPLRFPGAPWGAAGRGRRAQHTERSGGEHGDGARAGGGLACPPWAARAADGAERRRARRPTARSAATCQGCGGGQPPWAMAAGCPRQRADCVPLGAQRLHDQHWGPSAAGRPARGGGSPAAWEQR